MRWKAALLAIGACLAVRPAVVLACTCGGSGTPAWGYASAQAVFVGRVVGQGNTSFSLQNHNPVSFDIEVIESWKGVAAPRMTVVTGRGGGDCGLQLHVGDEYVIYAYGDGTTPLAVSMCSRTAPVAQASEDIRYLRTLPGLPLAPASGVPTWVIALGGITAVAVLAYGYGFVPRWRRGVGEG